MKLLLISIALRPGSGPAQALLELYTSRLATYIPVESQVIRSEANFLEVVARHRTRTLPLLVLLDSRGSQLNSEEFAAWLGAQRDSGRQLVLFAIGPADGWSERARQQARDQNGLLLSLGSMTLPHELARVVLAEQIYRAFTILAGHPYHAGHASP